MSSQYGREGGGACAQHRAHRHAIEVYGDLRGERRRAAGTRERGVRAQGRVSPEVPQRCGAVGKALVQLGGHHVELADVREQHPRQHLAPQASAQGGGSPLPLWD